jgi:hypothetical protein
VTTGTRALPIRHLQLEVVHPSGAPANNVQVKQIL